MVLPVRGGLTKGAPESNAVNHCGQLIDHVVYKGQRYGVFVEEMASLAVGKLDWCSVSRPSGELKIVACNEVNPDPAHY
jgi:hypothetical protein